MRCSVPSQSPKRKRGIFLACASGSVFVLLLLASSLPAQFPPPVTPPAKPQAAPISALGTEGFRAILTQYGLKPLKSFDELNQDPRHTVLIAFRGSNANGEPYPDLLNNNPRLLRSFVDDGGSVLVATDQKTEGGWADSFNVRVFGTQIQAFERDDYQECYLSNPVCPFIKRAKVGQVPDLFHLSVEQRQNLPKRWHNRTELTEVATNRPSFLEASNELETLAIIKPNCREEDQGKKQGRRLYGPLHFAQAKWYPNSHGKILVMADHSIFINEMLLPPQGQGENDNLAFTLNTLDWLTAGPDGKRTQVLFIDQTGTIETDFNSLLQQLPPPIPSIDNLPEFLQFLWDNRDKASEVVAAMEDAGVFQEIEQHMDEFFLEHIGLWQIIRTLLIFGMIAIFAISCRRVFGSRFRFAKAAPRLSLALDRFRPRGNLLEQRLRGSLRGGQCYEAARIRARQMFAEVDWTPAPEGGPSPRVQINTGWWQRNRIERDLRELWKIAFGTEPVPVPAKRWDKWVARLREIHKLIKDGVIRIA